MAADPFVAPELDDEPRQLQNLAPGVCMPPARPWYSDRPGDEVAYGQPRGRLFGVPGPNIGYALTLAQRIGERLTLAPHERLDDALAVVSELAMKRAASFGRAPVMADLVVQGRPYCVERRHEYRNAAVWRELGAQTLQSIDVIFDVLEHIGRVDQIKLAGDFINGRKRIKSPAQQYLPLSPVNLQSTGSYACHFPEYVGQRADSGAEIEHRTCTKGDILTDEPRNDPFIVILQRPFAGKKQRKS